VRKLTDNLNMNNHRPAGLYLLIMALLVGCGLPSRMIPAELLPRWYVLYFGDFLWAMLIFFGLALALRKVGTLGVVMLALSFTYVIEVTQLFHPPWLEYLRTIKLCALVIGYDFSWTDLVAYTLGIGTGGFMEWVILRRGAASAGPIGRGAG
jgi:Protein of unknown function (DUF2809)